MSEGVGVDRGYSSIICSVDEKQERHMELMNANVCPKQGELATYIWDTLRFLDPRVSF